MARKKTITEFQEEQPQDMIVPDGDTAVEDTAPGLTEDAAAGDEDGCSASIKAPAENEGGTEFVWPPAEDAPLEETSEGGTKDQGEALPEPPVEDGAFPAEGEDHSDYTAYFPTDGEGSENSTLDNPSPLPEYPMLRKRRRFYLDTDELGRHMIEEDSIVQARVVAVAEKVLRAEVFGVECNVAARGSSWLWAGSARDRHYVGEIIPVRVLKIDRPGVDRITVQVDARDVFGDEGDNLSNCQVQCRYVGQVTDMRRGVVYVRLNNGVNAIAHTCYDARMPGKKDTVSFAVTRLDEAHGIAIGIITRIIKQNL